jgi:hypothetical protein
MFIRKTSITLLPISTMIATLAVVMNEGNLSHPIPTAKAWIVNNVQIISDDGADEMILKQFNDLHSAIKKRKSNKNNKVVLLLTVISNGMITLSRKAT